ncbi:MAG: hypothetical protein ACPGVO_13685 [Spirulinaceae cyanobacterium]
MPLTNQKINTENKTFNILLLELKEECQNVVALISQLQRSELSDRQRGEILAELLAASIHLNTHCDEDWQDLIANTIEGLD